MTTLRLILGDQLNEQVVSLRDAEPNADIILMAEVMEEATYVKHHKKKIAFLFSAMRHFAAELKADGYDVRYTKIDDKENSGDLFGEVKKVCSAEEIDRLVVCEPGEWRLLEKMKGWQKKLNIPVEIREDDRFYATHQRFNAWATDGRKELTMEFFYREMRKESGILMDGKKPAGGKWNFDKENRKPLKKGMQFSAPMQFSHDKITKDVLAIVEEKFGDHFGDLEPFTYAVTQGDARRALAHFIAKNLPTFGDYQDAMAVDEAFLSHSIIAHYINCGLLSPQECCAAAEQAYQDGHAPINAVEGFIRQILGWREFIRGIYWLHMPDYKERNTLKATRPLPDFYWTGETKMRCISEVVKSTKQHAYSHHIQRLMVTGNFALLAGLDVEEMCDWYLAVYADAYEWVELPNTLGMALYGDDGVVGTKPYGSSGAYINRMSNFCASCEYNVKAKTGEEACPFNYLYWDFMLRHQGQFKDNQRMGLVYNNIAKKSNEELEQIQRDAKRFLESL